MDDFKIPNISLWNTDATLRSSVGYRNNPTLSSSGSQGNAFGAVGGDLLVFRLPTGGWQFNAFASYHYLNYVSLNNASGISDEHLGMVMSQLSKDLGNNWKSGVSVFSMYQHQVVDTSLTQTNGASNTAIEGETVTGRWFLRKDFKPYWTEISLSGSRQWLKAPLDSFWQPAGQLAAGRGFGHGSELSLSYQWADVDFDTREQVDNLGYAIADTHLTLQSHCIELAWRQVWDQKKHWSTTTKAGLNYNEDNGSGYFNYWQYRLAEQLKYHAETWEISASGTGNDYAFSVQPVSLTDLTLHHKTTVTAGVHGEKKLGKHFKIFGDFTWERANSNAGYDAYESSTTSAGVEYHF